jgi:hypothetical protein
MAAPTNDDFVDAHWLTALSGTVSGTTIDATVDAVYDAVDDWWGGIAGGTVWYKLILPEGFGQHDSVSLQMVAPDAPNFSELILLLFDVSASPPANSGDVTLYEALDSEGTYATTHTGTAPAGNVYYVGIGNYGSTPYAFELSWEVSQAQGRVCIAFDDGPREPDPEWTPIDTTPNLVASIEISVGRQDEQDETKTGTATVRLNDTAGLFDPDNTGSPYFGKLDGKQIRLSLQDPVTGAWHIRFRGLVDDYGYDLNPATRGGVSVVSNVTVECVDMFDYLAGADFRPGVHGNVPPPGSKGGVFYEDGEVDTRLIALLTDAAVDPSLYVVFSGNVLVQETTYDPSDSFLVALRDAADAEFVGIANIYCDRRGRFVFHGRGARVDPDGVAAGASPGAWDFQRWNAGDGSAIALDPDRAQVRAFGFGRSRSRIINSVLTTPRGVLDKEVPALVYEDATSILDYGLHSKTFIDLIHGGHKTNGNSANDECLLVSTFYVENYKVPRNRIATLTFKAIRPGDARAAATWQILSRADISDVVDVAVGYPDGVGVAETFNVEGWTQTITPLNPGHDMVELSLNVSPTAYYTENVWPDG